MRLIYAILLVCLTPVSPAFSANDPEDRAHPADDNAVCMDRNMDSARGGCVSNESGTPRGIPPQALPPERDTTRQSPPGAAATLPGELPAMETESR